MHLASSASNFKGELKNTLLFWFFFLFSFFCQCNLNPFTDLQGGKEGNNKEKHPDFPRTIIQLKGEDNTNNSPLSQKQGPGTHLTRWSKGHT